MVDIVPKLFEHIVKVYDLMDARSYSGPTGTEKYFEGKTTEILRDVGLTSNYYTPVFRYLKASGAITQLERGGGGKNSTYQLNGRPQLEDYGKISKKSAPSKTDKAYSTVTQLAAQNLEMRRDLDELIRVVAILQSRVMGVPPAGEKKHDTPKMFEDTDSIGDDEEQVNF